MSTRTLKSAVFLALVLSVAFLGSAFLTRPANGVSSNPNAKDTTFYWHYINSPVSVGGIQTHYVLNTTAQFDFSTQQLAKQNSLYKPTSQPTITVTFDVYPNLAGPATIDGTWQVLTWINASASTPAVFKIQFQEFPLGSGTATWNSGLLSPNVIPSSNVGPQVQSYNLTTPTPLTHTFAASSTIEASVTVTPSGAANDIRIWYDSPFYPSKVILPAVDRGHPAKIWTEDATGFVTSAFAASSGLKVLVNANATDPFGGYDLNATRIGSPNTRATLTVTDPAGTIIVNAQRMTLMSGGVSALNNLLQFNLTLTSGLPGQYSVVVSTTDNSGNVEQLTFTFTLGQTHKLGVYIVDSKNRPLPGSVLTASVGGFQVFRGTASSAGTVNTTLVAANYTINISWQGVTVYQSLISLSGDLSITLVTAVYDPAIIVVDDTGAPLPGAVVSVTHPNGTVLPTLMTTGTNGDISLARAPAGGWAFIVLWKTVNVYDSTVQINSDGPYTLKSKVYQFTVTVKDNRGLPVQGAYVVLYNFYGVVYDFKATDSTGSVTLKVPVGTYRIDALYSTTYLYTPVTSSASQSNVSVASSGALTLTLADFPPSVLSTSAFFVLVLALTGVAVASLVTYLVMKRRLPGLLAKLRLKSNSSPP